MISLRSVRYDYPAPASPIQALAGVDLDVHSGEVLALVGANGSGKSTVARLCNGLLTPTGGTVTVDGMSTSDPEVMWDVRARVGLVLQDPDDQIVGTSVETDAAFGPENLGVPRSEIIQRIGWALAVVGLDELRDREPHLLSQGQKQRLAIAGALAMRPAYLVLDEPTAMLDPSGRADVVEVIERLAAEQETGVLHITHRLDEIARADRVVALEDGAVAYDGSPTGLLGDPDLMDRCSISPPGVWRLAQELRVLGLPVPVEALAPEAIIGALPC